jgi:hypothetical protein
MKKGKIWLFQSNMCKLILLFRCGLGSYLRWGILTRPQVGYFQVATGGYAIINK